MPLPVKGSASAARISLVRDYDVSKIFPAARVLSSSVPPSQPDKHRGPEAGEGKRRRRASNQTRRYRHPCRLSWRRWERACQCGSRGFAGPWPPSVRFETGKGRDLPGMVTIGP